MLVLCPPLVGGPLFLEFSQLLPGTRTLSGQVSRQALSSFLSPVHTRSRSLLGLPGWPGVPLIVRAAVTRSGAQEEAPLSQHPPTPSLPPSHFLQRELEISWDPTGLRGRGRAPGNQKPGLGPSCVTPESWRRWLRDQATGASQDSWGQGEAAQVSPLLSVLPGP